MGIFDAIGDAVSAAVDVVGDMAEVAVGVATLDVGGVIDGMSAMVEDVGDTFEAVTEALGPVGSVLEEAVGAIASGGGLGGILNTALDSLGLPDWIGDVAGGVLDFCTGNYVGAVANGLDALEDVAKACGGDEIAGFLKVGSEVTGMFSPGGLGKLGKLGGAGQVGQVLGQVSATVSNIEHSMGAVNALMDGDIVGAGVSILDTFGPGLGELDGVLGPLSKSAGELLGAARDPTSAILGALGGALEDGRLGLDDLAAPFSALANDHFNFVLDDLFGGLSKVAEDAFGESFSADQMEDLFGAMGGAATDFITLGHDFAEGIKAGGMRLDDIPLVDTLLGGVVAALTDAVGFSAEDMARIQDTIQFGADLFGIAAQDPDALSILQDLLSQAPVPSQMLQTILHQGGALRA